jgi:L-threonylcarbamoyladenylate synthase
VRTQLIPAERWREALPILQSHQVIALPTDTVYGVAALPEDPEAIDAVYAAKDRPAEKALPMLVSDIEQAQRIADLDQLILRLCGRFWPGALTIVAPARSSFHSLAISDDGTVALRMPDLPLALEVIQAAGGVLAVTSANISGREPARDAATVLEQLDGRIAAVIDGGLSPGGVPSTVAKLNRGELELLRAGAIQEASLRSALAGQ